MPKLTIDGRRVEVPPGATILDAAQTLGIEIPTLCYLKGYKPSTSCLVCMVKICGPDKLVPSCATAAEDGMIVESETAEVHQVRKTALELLLSDHVGDCLGPCYFACPAHMDVPVMLRQIGGRNFRDAIVTIKRDIALPAVLGRICPKPCESICRRNTADGPVAVCRLKREAADRDLASGEPYLPPCAPDSGRRVAIVGAGPAGLAAAFHLRQYGHACTIFDDRPEPGGRLHDETTPDQLPRDVLAAEVRIILQLGVELRSNTRVDTDPSLSNLAGKHDAVLVACGAADKAVIERWGLKAAQRGIAVNKKTYETNLPGVFAAGNALRGKGLVVRSVADGKEAAESIDQFLSGRPVTGPKRPFSTRIGRVGEDEIAEFLPGAADVPRLELPTGTDLTVDQACEQAGRCLHCDCRGLGKCKLRRYCEMYGADPGRYRGERRPFEQVYQPSGVIYEPGKCIDCGLCIQIAEAAGEPLGLTFVGRGFDVRVGVPFNRSMEEALGKVAAQCIAACPTAALSFEDRKHASQLTIFNQT